MSGWIFAVAGYAGTETGDSQVGRGPRAVAELGTILAGEGGDRCTTIRYIV